MTDYEAWNELCDLYLSQHDYNNAAFCLEELIMSNPHNHLFHQKYAEVTVHARGSLLVAKTLVNSTAFVVLFVKKCSLGVKISREEKNLNRSSTDARAA